MATPIPADVRGQCCGCTDHCLALEYRAYHRFSGEYALPPAQDGEDVTWSGGDRTDLEAKARPIFDTGNIVSADSLRAFIRDRFPGSSAIFADDLVEQPRYRKAVYYREGSFFFDNGGGDFGSEVRWHRFTIWYSTKLNIPVHILGESSKADGGDPGTFYEYLLDEDTGDVTETGNLDDWHNDPDTDTSLGGRYSLDAIDALIGTSLTGGAELIVNATDASFRSFVDDIPLSHSGAGGPFLFDYYDLATITLDDVYTLADCLTDAESLLATYDITTLPLGYSFFPTRVITLSWAGGPDDPIHVARTDEGKFGHPLIYRQLNMPTNSAEDSILVGDARADTVADNCLVTEEQDEGHNATTEPPDASDLTWPFWTEETTCTPSFSASTPFTCPHDEILYDWGRGTLYLACLFGPGSHDGPPCCGF